MDLWRRSVQGRLAEVLGANFIERDAMTRRVQFRGHLDAEWASYGPDAKRIAAAFVRGVNARVKQAVVDLPEEVLLARWRPGRWRARCLLAATPGRLHRRGAAPVARSSRAIRTAASTTRRCATWCISGPPDGTWPGRPRRGCLVSRSATTSTSRGPWRRRASTCR